MEEDAQPLTEPIVAPMVKRDFDLLEKSIPETNFDYDFMAGLMTRPELIRNVRNCKLKIYKFLTNSSIQIYFFK